MNAEEKVRRAWEEVEPEDHSQCCGPDEPFRIRLGKHHARWEGTWSAAAAFTDEVLEQKRCCDQDCFTLQEQIDSDISILLTMDAIDPPFAVCIGEELARYARILAARQAALAELRRGMK